MIDNRSQTRGQTVASNAVAAAMLDDLMRDEKIMEDALAENANSFVTIQGEESSESHSLKLEAFVLGKDFGYATER
jgi:hypothetical protein